MTDEDLRKRLAETEARLARALESGKALTQQVKDLAEREARFREVVELANSIILRLDPSGGILFLNEFGLDFFGYRPEEVLGRNLVGVLVPPVESSGRDMADLVASIGRNPTRFTVNENENMRKDGSRVWVLWTNKAVADEEGRVTEILCIGNDITDRKESERKLESARNELEAKFRERTHELERTYEDLKYEVVARKIVEEELREEAGKYRNIVEQAVEGIFQTSDEGLCLMANPSLAEMLGYDSPQEFISAVTDVATQLFADPDCYSDFESIFDAKGYVKGFEARFRKKDGGVIWVSINARTVLDERGSFVCYEGTIEDVTARKDVERQLKESFSRLQRVMDGTTKALSMAIEIRDPYTAGHQARVMRLAVAIARDMGFSEEHVRAIQVAGILHDIGKIYVPAEILTRPGKISVHEYAVLRDHSEAGYEILKDIEFDYPIAEIVLQHHERIDGTGYPHGLRGDRISLDAKIISVADVVESMASHRPYRPSLGLEKALAEIRENRGILYDETVVDICFRQFREKGFAFRD